VKPIRQIGLSYAAGAFGALANSCLAWYLGMKGIPQHFGVAIAPKLTAGFLYPRLVWGGLWGFVFMIPIWRGNFWTSVLGRGVFLSFLPTLFQIFYVFPVLQGKGTFGLALGRLTPVFVILYNAIWGMATGLWLYFSNEEIGT